MVKGMIIPKANKYTVAGPVNMSVVNKDSIEAMTPETDKKVTGTFVNIECQGQPAKICGKYYKGMNYFSEVFEDGKKYTIPLSVARFINERINYEQHSYLTDAEGNPLKTGKTMPRYKFMIESHAA